MIKDLLDILIEFIKKYGPNIIYAVIIFTVGLLFAGGIKRVFLKASSKIQLRATVTRFLADVIHYLIIVMVVLMALGKLGIPTTSFIAILGSAGVAIAFAFKDSLANLAAGIMLIFFKAYDVGDYISVAGVDGSVKEVDIFHTVLLSFDNKKISIPNNSVISSHIINYSAMDTRRLDLVVGIAYDADLKLAKDVLGDLIASHTDILKDPAPVVAVSKLGESSVDLVMKVWVKKENYWDVLYALNEEAKLRFDEKGIEIPFKSLNVHLKDSGGEIAGRRQ